MGTLLLLGYYRIVFSPSCFNGEAMVNHMFQVAGREEALLGFAVSLAAYSYIVHCIEPFTLSSNPACCSIEIIRLNIMFEF